MSAGGGLPLTQWDASPTLKSWFWGSGGCHRDTPLSPWPSLENWLWLEYWQACGSLLLFLIFSFPLLPPSLPHRSPWSFFLKKAPRNLPHKVLQRKTVDLRNKCQAVVASNTEIKTCGTIYAKHFIFRQLCFKGVFWCFGMSYWKPGDINNLCKGQEEKMLSM